MLIVHSLCWKKEAVFQLSVTLGRFLVSQTPILNFLHNGVRKMGLSVRPTASPPSSVGFVPASK